MEGLVRRMHSLQHSTLRINCWDRGSVVDLEEFATEVRAELNSKAWEFLKTLDSVQIYRAKTRVKQWDFDFHNLCWERKRNTKWKARAGVGSESIASTSLS